MLPFTNLLSPDLLKFDNTLSNMEIMPGDAVDPEASFGDLLAGELLELPQLDALPGETLPLDGNALPPPPVDGEAPAIVGLPVAVPNNALPASGAVPGDAIAEQLPAVTPSAPVAKETTPGVSIVDPTQTVVTRTGPVSPDVLAERQPVVASTPLPGANARLQVAENATGEPLVVREAQAAALARAGADETGDRQQQSGDRDPRFMRISEPQLRQPPTESLAPATFQAAREDAAAELRGLQQLGQQLQQSQATQPVTQVNQGAQPTLTNPAAALRPGAEPALPVSTPVTDPAWGEQIGERVVMMAGKQLQNAEIRLSPAELGPLRVQVRVDDGAANVTFHAHHAITRDAIEQAMPRLREMFAENGLNLGQTSVNEQGVGQQGQAGRDAETHAGTANGYDAEAENAPDAELQGEFEPRRILDGFVDTFV